MARKKFSTTLYIEFEQDARLKELHKNTNVPVAVFIREGIDMVLAKYGVRRFHPHELDDIAQEKAEGRGDK